MKEFTIQYYSLAPRQRGPDDIAPTAYMLVTAQDYDEVKALAGNHLPHDCNSITVASGDQRKKCLGRELRYHVPAPKKKAPKKVNKKKLKR